MIVPGDISKKLTYNELKLVQKALGLAIVKRERDLEKIPKRPSRRHTMGEFKLVIPSQYRTRHSQYKQDIKRFQEVASKISLNILNNK